MKTMNFFIVLALLCLVFWVKPGEVFSQPFTDSTVNFYTLSAYYDHYYDSLIQVRGSENMKGTGYTDYLRWKWFYTGRHGANGDLTEIYQAIQDYQENYQAPLNFIDDSDWKYAGPFHIPLGPDGASSNGTGKGMMLSLWVDPGSHSLIYAGSHHGGLWKTVDGGLNWRPLNDQNYDIHGVNSIAVDPTDYNTIYITSNSSLGSFSNYSTGLFKSIDGGNNWERLATPDPIIYPGDWKVDVRKIIITPGDPLTLYFLTYKDVLRSVDNGSSWDIVFSRNYFPWEDPEDPLNCHNGFFDFKITPWNNNLAYLAGSEVFSVSLDTWSNSENISDNVFLIGLNQGDAMINHPHRCEISMNENYPGWVWFCYACNYEKEGEEKNYLRIVRLDESGYHLLLDEDISGFINIGVSKDKLEFTVSPSDPDIFYVGGVELNQYKVNGVTTSVTKLTYGDYPEACWVHDDIRDMQIFSDGTHDTLFLANDAGISWGALDETNPEGCDNREWHWHHPFNSEINGLDVTEFYGIGAYKGPSDLVAGGCQDLGYLLLNDGNWTEFPIGDGSEVVWDPVDPNTFYFTEWQTGALYRTNDLGAHSYDFDFIGKSTVMMPLEVDRHSEPNPDNSYTILYTGIKDLDNPPFKATLVKYSYVDKFEQGYPVRAVLHNFYDSLSDIEIAIPDQVEPRYYISTFKSYSNDNNPPDPEFYSGCIYKSYFKDNTRYYQDISKNLLGCIAGFISDIEVNPSDTANIWVSFAEYSKFDPENPIYKVYTTDDGGSTWQTFAKGLPYGMPVFNLKIVPGLHKLYLLGVTDVGIFKNDLLEPDEGWYPFNNNLPAKIVTDLEINRDKNTIIASTFGRGLWKTPYICHYINQPETIVGSPTWQSTRILDHSIIIPKDITLTIRNCSVYLPSEAKFVVEQGGTLILDNCTLTSACNDLWWGVEVWGDPRYPQTGNYQGNVIMQNNATIEKARKAIFCGKGIEYENPDRIYTGGIVKATDAWFLNNRNGVMLWYYPFENTSTFTNCKFFTTDTLADGSSPDYFMTLVKVNGIAITGCKFENQKSVDLLMQYHGTGIFALDAGFEVKASNLPFGTPSSFKNLEYGVYAMKYMENQPIIIHDAFFYRNLTGVYARGIEQLQLYSNTIEVDRLDYHPDHIYGGVYLEHCTGYEIQKNTFYGQTASEGQVGLTINNSGEAFNQIKNNNIFRNLYVGTLAQNNNYSIDEFSGLKIICNDYSDNEYDIAVTGYDGCKDCGIAYYQGSMNAPAGNTFSKHVTPDYSDYYNETLPVQYFHHAYNMFDPENWYPENVSPEPFIYRNNTGMTHDDEYCGSRNDSINSINSIKSLYSYQILKSDSLKALLSELIDGGNTQSLEMDIDLSQQDESLELQQELLNTSPYLSDTILIKSAQKENVLTPAMVKEIMVANPHSAKSDKVMAALDNRDNPLPELMMQEILRGRDTISQRELLEAEYSDAGFQKEMALNRLISLYRADTLNDNTDSIIHLLTDYNTIPTKYRLMMAYLDENDTASAKNILQNIPQQFELTGSQALINDHWNDYLDILLEIKKDSIMLQDLDSLQIEKLFDIAQFDDQPGCLAENILHFLGRIKVSPVYILPEDQLKSMPDGLTIPHTTILGKEPYIKLYPNPAKNYIVVEYGMNGRSSEGNLHFYNSSGRLKFKITLVAQKNYQIINTKDWVDGIYLYNFISNYQNIESGKLIIAK